MTDQPSPPEPEESEHTQLTRLFAEGLAPIAPPPRRNELLKTRLMERVAASRAAHAGLMTVRAKDGAWRALKPGIRVKPLWAGPQGSSVLIELAPGAALPRHRHLWVEEGIVLRGGVRMGDLELGPFDYHLSPAGSRHQPIRSPGGALAFLRGTSLGDPYSELRELLGGLLPFRGGPARTVYAGDEGWEEVAPGVAKKELWSGGGLASRFFRMEPGARLPGHVHALDEECLMLKGDVFLGDILLRAGEYQRAPAGTRHGEIYSDVGALLFVRGQA